MKAITTKFHGPTNTKPSRYSASDQDGNKVTLSTDFTFNSDGNHDRAAVALCHKMGWLTHNLVRGSLAQGYVYVFDLAYERVPVVKAEVA